MTDLAPGLLLLTLGVFLVTRTVTRDATGRTLVDRLLGAGHGGIAAQAPAAATAAPAAAAAAGPAGIAPVRRATRVAPGTNARGFHFGGAAAN